MQISFKEGLNEDYKDLVVKLLRHDSDQRVALIEVFSHPWILSY